tara:strand:- start:138008 stop:138355 length:348 start_codon:yes stop_codon:yes gene_type:complete
MKFNDIPCICCGDIISNISPNRGNAIDIIDTKKDYTEVGMWGDGEVSRVEFGYGSILDGSVFYIGLCDSCAEQKANNGEIYYSHDYMGINNINHQKWESAMTSKLREIEINKIVK